MSHVLGSLNSLSKNEWYLFASWNFKHILLEPEWDEINRDTINKTTVISAEREGKSVFSLNSELISENDKDFSFFSVTPA